jgi:uncharacterized protein
MVFKRKNTPGFKQKFLAAVWPKKGFVRPLKYSAFRIMRLRASPHRIAGGVAAGVASAFTPFIGIHFFVSFAFAWLLRGSMISAALATVVAGNPLTYPLIWAGTWEVGRIVMGQTIAADSHGPNLHALFSHISLSDLWAPVIEPMLIGSIPLALILGALSYGLAFYGADLFQKRKFERLEARAFHLEAQRKAAGEAR